MPRIRTVKPEFWTDEKLSACPMQARLLFLALFNEADDWGLLKANPTFIANRVFPYETLAEHVQEWLAELERGRFLLGYTVGDCLYYAIRTWHRHQRVDHPGNPECPVPPPEILDACVPPRGGWPTAFLARCSGAAREPLAKPREVVASTPEAIPSGAGSDRESVAPALEHLANDTERIASPAAPSRACADQGKEGKGKEQGKETTPRASPSEVPGTPPLLKHADEDPLDSVGVPEELRIMRARLRTEVDPPYSDAELDHAFMVAREREDQSGRRVGINYVRSVLRGQRADALRLGKPVPGQPTKSPSELVAERRARLQMVETGDGSC